MLMYLMCGGRIMEQLVSQLVFLASSIKTILRVLMLRIVINPTPEERVIMTGLEEGVVVPVEECIYCFPRHFLDGHDGCKWKDKSSAQRAGRKWYVTHVMMPREAKKKAEKEEEKQVKKGTEEKGKPMVEENKQKKGAVG